MKDRAQHDRGSARCPAQRPTELRLGQGPLLGDRALLLDHRVHPGEAGVSATLAGRRLSHAILAQGPPRRSEAGSLPVVQP